MLGHVQSSVLYLGERPRPNCLSGLHSKNRKIDLALFAHVAIKEVTLSITIVD